MKTQLTLFRPPRAVFRGGLVVCLALAAARSLPADTLTGTVWQPTVKLGARASSVLVIDRDTDKKLAGPDTTDANGTYTFEGIPSGKRIEVKARWDMKRSSPGASETSVDANPKKADVQLLPALDASAGDWLVAGQHSADGLGDGVTPNFPPHVTDYNQALYLVGKSNQLRIAFPEAGRLDDKTADSLAAMIIAGEKHYRATGSVPGRQYLEYHGNRKLTDDQFAAVLGSIAPKTGTRQRREWDAKAAAKSNPETTKETTGKTAALDRTPAKGVPTRRKVPPGRLNNPAPPTPPPPVGEGIMHGAGAPGHMMLGPER
jgi:hypothetical protein